MGYMTVSGQVKQTIASLKGVKVTLETFACVEENQEAKQVYERNIPQIDSVIEDMQKRLGKLEFEEPQYKGF